LRRRRDGRRRNGRRSWDNDNDVDDCADDDQDHRRDDDHLDDHVEHVGVYGQHRHDDRRHDDRRHHGGDDGRVDLHRHDALRAAGHHPAVELRRGVLGSLRLRCAHL
jgi:hypothetical protein